MGYSSSLCKRCDHGILDANSTDEGINEWMAEVVILNPDGNMTIDTKYTGYAGDYERFDGPQSVWLHKACYELANRPHADAFDGPSGSDEHQGAGGTHAHIIDPRITDLAERARMLEAGLAKRNARIYTGQAREVHEWLDKSERKYHREKHGGEMWRLRFNHYSQRFLRDENDELVLSDPEKPWSYVEDPTGWSYSDKLSHDEIEGTSFTGTEDELKAHLAAEWAKFLESAECAAYVAHRDAEIAKYRAEKLEELKAEGRFKISYHPDHDHRNHTVFYVMDEFEYGSDVTKFSTNDHESRKAASDKAKAKRDTLNEAWAAAGHPAEFTHELFERQTYPELEEDEDE